MDHFNYQAGDLFAEGVPVQIIADAVGTPFYCYSSATLTRHYRVFSESLNPLKTKICYAVKANGNLAILKTLSKQGAGADVVSQGEIRLALAAGIKGENIVFSGVGKTREEMAFALDQNIFQFNIESESELLALSEVATSKDKQASIAFRVNPDVKPDTHAKISTGNKESKFGVPIEKAIALYAKAKATKGIKVQGVSVHIGSQLTSLAPFHAAFEKVKQLVTELRKQGHSIDTIDLGGGLGIPYSKESPPLPAAYGEMVKNIFEGMDATFMFEPGRVLVGNAGILVSRVIYVKRTDSRIFVILDSGMNDLMRPTLYGAYHEIIPVKGGDTSAPTEMVDIVGPVCETGDIFAEQRLLRVPKEGDLIAMRSAGAYGAAMASTYNARLLIPEVMVNEDKYAVIRPRPSYDDLIKQDKIPDWL